ncbi:hypothetical protein SNE40_009314 [Patella caerulea]
MNSTIPPTMDRMFPVSTLNRIAIVACERIMLMMNNTGMLLQPKIQNMQQVLAYLSGQHIDVGCCGDRGDFFRRKLAEELYLTYSVHGVTHNNIFEVVSGAILLEADTRLILSESTLRRDVAPPVKIDPQVLDILARIAGIH